MVQGGNGESSSKKLHPFFTKADARAPAEEPSITDLSTSPPVSAGSEISAQEANPEESTRKRHQAEASLMDDESEPKKRRRRRKSKGDSLTGAILNHLTRSRRPATASAAVEDSIKKIPSPPLSEVSLKHDDHGEAAANAEVDAPPAKVVDPKRVLRFNPKTGKLGSPPKPKPSETPSRIVCIKYGKDAEDRRRVGDRISQILQGTAHSSVNPPEKPENADTAKVKTKPTPGKSTHPFFSKAKPDPGKAGDGATKPLVEKKSIFLSTPVSPRKPRSVFPDGRALRFGIQSSGAKVPGAMHPMWPAQGMSHVRGDDGPRHKTITGGASPHRKFKGLTTIVAPHESLLNHVTDSMGIPSVRESLTTDVASVVPPPTALRLPQKHFESGRKLRNRIRSQIQTRFVDKPLYEDGDLSPDELSGPPAARAHPGLEWLYASLETQLSAYDRSCCESLAWTQKYAPRNSAQVLQRGREAVLLREWLQTLRVQSVESGSVDEKDHDKAEGCPKRKRKKAKLEGFIVEDEDESDTMYEISAGDDTDSDPEKGPRHRKKTIMREGDLALHPKHPKRLANAILVSGPHGCGKTAAVYAAAKELDFEVFEINAGSRRSGKDMLEKVGDMTRNHLVQRNRADPVASDADEVANEIKTGAQGMMTAFFKPKEEEKEEEKEKKKEKKEKQTRRGRKKKGDESADGASKTTPGKTHKQSLILVEEVDILFEEDKQFWATLTGLIAQSKRPFIMTCNDENLVPTQSLSLHGILRFSPVPGHLAVDTCLLIAANEGHALARPAVEALYRSRNSDLRATITELNYWCQMGVGDCRGGFDWFYLRWPKGCDRDANGDVVRVVSQDTYRRGMGWLARDDIMATTPDPLKAEEEAMHQSWESWQHDAGDWSQTPEFQSWATAEPSPRKPRRRQSSALAAIDSFYSAMSDADACSSGAYRTALDEALDASVPALPKSTRDDFILGQTLLRAQPPPAPHASTSKAISTALRSLARETLSSARSRPRIPPLDELRTTSILDRALQHPPSAPLTRPDVLAAFDPLAAPPSVLDRPLALVVLDVAPWIRSIVAHDHAALQSRPRKRTRTTRSALSALEGGERAAKKTERHFGDALSVKWVMRTAGRAWESVTTDGESAAGSPASDELGA